MKGMKHMPGMKKRMADMKKKTKKAKKKGKKKGGYSAAY